MKEFSILIIISIVFFACVSVKSTKDLQSEDLNGNVRSIVAYKNETKDIDNVTEKERPENSRNKHREVIFNNNGDRTNISYYKPDGSFDHHVTYKYNSDHKLIEEKSYNFNRLTTISTYRYDNWGRKYERSEHVLSTGQILKMKFKYDEKGNIFEMSHHFSDSSFIVSKSKFDENNNEVEFTSFNKKGDSISKMCFIYDKKNNKTGEYCYGYDSIKTLELTILREYDRKGNVIKSNSTFYPISKISTELTFDYTYDKNRNWIKQKLFIEDSLVGTVDRIIEYYK